MVHKAEQQPVEQSTEQPAQDTPPTDQEHPVFVPESQYWGSRPPEHLAPQDPRTR